MRGVPGLTAMASLRTLLRRAAWACCFWAAVLAAVAVAANEDQQDEGE